MLLLISIHVSVSAAGPMDADSHVHLHTHTLITNVISYSVAPLALYGHKTEQKLTIRC